MAETEDRHATYVWGNATYVDLAIGDTFTYLGREITLLEVDGKHSAVQVGDVRVSLIKVVRALPVEIDGIRLFVADNRVTKELTTDPEVHGLLQKDALLCLSDASKPLLDPGAYTFPIGREDGYRWHMEETSGMFAYYGEPWQPREGYFRSHEGIDFNLHEGRGIERHPLVAIEDGTVRWVVETNEDEACLLLQSAANPHVYYVYQHLNKRLCFAEGGQAVKKGERLAYIWGDGVWGHLHFAITYRAEAEPVYRDRYWNTLNFFPQMYALWHGDLEKRPRVWTNGRFVFAHDKKDVENKLSAQEYDEIVGYGWRINDWCDAGAMQRYPRNFGSIPLNKVMHRGHPAESVNPHDYYDFEIRVEPGVYEVQARVGDAVRPTWQRVSFEGVEAGVFELEPQAYEWTETVKVWVDDDRLTVRFYLRDRETTAGISEILIAKADD